MFVQQPIAADYGRLSFRLCRLAVSVFDAWKYVLRLQYALQDSFNLTPESCGIAPQGFPPNSTAQVCRQAVIDHVSPCCLPLPALVQQLSTIIAAATAAATPHLVVGVHRRVLGLLKPRAAIQKNV